MNRVVEKSSSYAGYGGMIGGAIGLLFKGTIIALPGVNIILMPIVATGAVEVSCSAVGTLIGAGVGMVSGAAEAARERKQAG